MSSYLLKINASPIMINRLGLEKISGEFIPQLLDKTFGKTSVDKQYRLEDSCLEMINDSDYRMLIKDTALFKRMYNEVLEHYKVYGDFSYTKQYLDLIDSLKQRRRILEKRYPFVLYAYRITNKSAKAKICTELVGKVGTGVDHLTKMSKIEIFLEKKLADFSMGHRFRSVFSYSDNERLSLQTSSKSNVHDDARAIENQLNRSLPYGQRKAESIHINPMFDCVTLLKDKQRGDVDLSVDYPNGDTDLEYEAMISGILKKTNSRDAVITLRDAELDCVEENIQRLGQKGYLRDVVLRGKSSIIDYAKSSYKRSI